MPKARFNPERHRSRVRHNPLARSGGESATAAAPTAAAGSAKAGSSAAAAAELSIPLLLKLPLPGTHVEPAPSSSDTHWALSSLSLLLLEKPARRVLLAPQHRLLPRLVRALEHDEPAVRAEASGALRNVCIDAGFAERTRLADADTYAVIVRQMVAVSLALDGQAAAPQQARTAPVVPNKPLEEMNHKERRHAKKAANAGAAAAAAGADGALERMDAADGQDEEELSPLHAHLTNLCVVLWCILEASSAHLAPLTPHFADVMDVLCATIRRATAASNVARGEGGAAREAARIRAAEREAGIAAANTLLTLTDAHAFAAIALVGIPRTELDAALNQGKKPNPKRSGPAPGPDVSTSKGKRQLNILADAVGQIMSTLSAGAERESLQPVSLGLLALGSLCNASNSLPPSLRERIVLSATSQLPPAQRAQAGSMEMPLSDFEANYAVAPLLVTVETLGEEWKNAPAAPPAAAAPDAQMEVEGNGETTESVTPPTQTRAEIKNEELVGALQLALEVLAEIVGAVGVAHAVAAGPDDNDDGWGDDGDDEEMAIDGDDADGMEEDAPAAPRMALPSSADEFSKHPLATLATGIVPRVMLWMAQPPASPLSDATQLEALNSLATRALSVLSNLFHGLAVMAPPPPSEPRPEHASLHASFAAWRGASPALQATWQQAFELALALGAQGDARRAALEACMNVLYALARCFEGAALPVQASAFPATCPLAQASSGVLEALLAASAPGAPVGSDDALRVSAISTLGPLARGGSVSHADVARIGDALVRVAESLPAPGEAATATTCGNEAVLAALDAAIDTFADETSAWDAEAFVQPALLPRLKKLLPRVRALARAIDKRKQPQLRESADGTVDNLKGFVAYREQ